MDRRSRNQRGFTLGWVMLTLMILMVFLIFCLTAAGGYVSKDFRRHSRMQAEFTSKTIAQTIAGDMSKRPVEGSIRGLLESAIVEPNAVTLGLEGLDPGMGQVSLTLVYKEDEKRLSVAVRTILEQEEAIVVLYLKQDGAKVGWEPLGYSSGMETEVLR